MKRSRAQQNRPIDRKRILLMCVLGIVLVSLTVVGVYWIARQTELNTYTEEETHGDLTGRFREPRIVSYNNSSYRYRDDLTTILLMGIDRADAQTAEPVGFRDGGQADFLLLLILDAKNKTITPLQFDRDTMTEITILGVLGNDAGTRNAQICLSHGFGDGKEQSCQFTAEAVSKLLLGVDIDFYISLDMASVAQFNDALGGVTVTLADDFSGYDPAMTVGTTLTLRGMQAQYYVRGRMTIGDGTNESRMARHRDYMTKAGDQLTAKLREDAGFVGTLFDSLKTDLVTDMSRGRLINEAYASRNYASLDTVTPVGQHTLSQLGFVEFHADPKALEELVLRLFFEKIDPA